MIAFLFSIELLNILNASTQVEQNTDSNSKFKSVPRLQYLLSSWGIENNKHTIYFSKFLDNKVITFFTLPTTQEKSQLVNRNPHHKALSFHSKRNKPLCRGRAITNSPTLHIKGLCLCLLSMIFIEYNASLQSNNTFRNQKGQL